MEKEQKRKGDKQYVKNYPPLCPCYQFIVRYLNELHMIVHTIMLLITI